MDLKLPNILNPGGPDLGAELDGDERHDAPIDLLRRNRRRRHAAQIEQREAERWGEERRLQVDGDHHAQPHRIQPHGQQHRTHDGYDDESYFDKVQYESQQEHYQHHHQHGTKYPPGELVQQLLDLGTPVAVALTMGDAAEASGISIDVDKLRDHLNGAPVCPVVATTGQGIGDLHDVLVNLVDQPAPEPTGAWPELTAAARALAKGAAVPLSNAEIERLLIEGPTGNNQHVLGCLGDDAEQRVEQYREGLFGFDPPLAREAHVRYAWVR